MEGVRETIAEWRNPVWTIIEFAKGMQIAFAGATVGIIACIIFGTGLYQFQKTEPLVVQVLILPVIVTIAVMVALGHPLFPRSFFFTIGFGALIVVRGVLTLTQIGGQWGHLEERTIAILGTVACVCMIGISALSVPWAYAPKQDYGQAISYVEKKS